MCCRRRWHNSAPGRIRQRASNGVRGPGRPPLSRDVDTDAHRARIRKRCVGRSTVHQQFCSNASVCPSSAPENRPKCSKDSSLPALKIQVLIPQTAELGLGTSRSNFTCGLRRAEMPFEKWTLERPRLIHFQANGKTISSGHGAGNGPILLSSLRVLCFPKSIGS